MRMETEGVVLRQIKPADGRKILVLFTKDKGKVSVGTGQSPGSKTRSALPLRPFTYARYRLFRNRQSYFMESADTIKSYYNIGQDVDRYMYCSYVLEFTEKMIAEEEPAPGLFNLLIDFLDLMDSRKRKFETPVIAYQLKAMKMLGVAPELERCVECGKLLTGAGGSGAGSSSSAANGNGTVSGSTHGQHGNGAGAAEPYCFSTEDGGLICADCIKERLHDEAGDEGKKDLSEDPRKIVFEDLRRKVRTGGQKNNFMPHEKLIYKVDFDIVRVLKYFLNNPMSSFRNLALEDELLVRVDRLVKGYMEYHLGIGKMKSEIFLEDSGGSFI